MPLPDGYAHFGGFFMPVIRNGEELNVIIEELNGALAA